MHHIPDVTPYPESNALGEALIAAAADAGIRITLLDTCYLTGGFGVDLQGPQVRFTDGSAANWAERVDRLTAPAHARVGAAIHSVRAVPADQLGTVASWAHEHGTPLHFHMSEQRAENEACLAAHGCTPTQLLADHGALGALSTAVHSTHLTDGDVATLWAPRWREGDDEWEAFLGHGDDLWHRRGRENPPWLCDLYPRIGF